MSELIIFLPGLVVSNELTNTNVLIQDVFTLLFQVRNGKEKESANIYYYIFRSTKWFI